MRLGYLTWSYLVFINRTPATGVDLWEKVFLKISQYSQENTCARVSFIMKLQVSVCNFINKKTLEQVFYLWTLWNFWEHLFYLLGDCFCIKLALKYFNKTIHQASINHFVSNAIFLQPLKTLEKGCIGNKWVKIFQQKFAGFPSVVIG